MPAKTKYTPELLKKFRSLVDKWDPFRFRGKDKDTKTVDEFFDKAYVVSLAVHLGVYRARIREYREKHEDFKEIYNKWIDKRDHYFHKIARLYSDRPAQWIYISKNILGWSDNPSHTEEDDNTLPLLIRAIEASADKIKTQKKKPASRRKK